MRIAGIATSSERPSGVGVIPKAMPGSGIERLTVFVAVSITASRATRSRRP
jgi:hypothetical protein